MYIFKNKKDKTTVPSSIGTCTITSVERTELRQFYDSTWRISLSDGKVFSIIRRDTETKEGLIAALAKLHAVSEIPSLDEKANIFYD